MNYLIKPLCILTLFCFCFNSGLLAQENETKTSEKGKYRAGLVLSNNYYVFQETHSDFGHQSDNLTVLPTAIGLTLKRRLGNNIWIGTGAFYSNETIQTEYFFESGSQNDPSIPINTKLIWGILDVPLQFRWDFVNTNQVSVFTEINAVTGIGIRVADETEFQDGHFESGFIKDRAKTVFFTPELNLGGEFRTRSNLVFFVIPGVRWIFLNPLPDSFYQLKPFSPGLKLGAELSFGNKNTKGATE